MHSDRRNTPASTNCRTWAGLLTGLAMLVAPLLVLAQPTPATLPPTTPATSPPPGDTSIPLSSIPPNLRLGVRANFIMSQVPVVPTLVIVPDSASFVAAVGKWRIADVGTLRFPVLIDDGSYTARARISRFSRAFQPQAVVRWSAAGDEARWPDAAGERQVRIDVALASVWGAPKPSEFLGHLKAKGFVPPGVVIAHGSDPACLAALALAAAHGQPLLWLAPPGFHDPATYITLETADAFNASVIKAVGETGFSYQALGDDLDAVTLCMATPSKVFLGENNKNRYYALTDLVGRRGEGAGRARWAWAGQIMGNESSAAYAAMCAVFLMPDRAWLFDGYGSGEPWSAFDMTSAADELKRGKFTTFLDDDPSGKGLPDMRIRASGSRARGANAAAPAGFGVDAGLIAMTTMGNADFFDLSPGQAKPGDIPMVRQPALAYIVHSFSAQSPTERWSVAGVWLERGVFAYVGSVDEPFLQRFVPTPLVMRRLMQGLPWGVAARFDDGPIWKIAVFGDPLMHFGPRGPRLPANQLPLSGGQNLADQLPDLLKNRDLTNACLALSLLGRDKDAARLLAATAKDQPELLTPELALAGVNAAYFAGDLPAMTAALEKLGPLMLDVPRVKKDGLAEIRDMAWHIFGPETSELTRREASALVWHLRPETLQRDIDEAIKRVAPSRGREAEEVVREMAARVRAANK